MAISKAQKPSKKKNNKYAIDTTTTKEILKIIANNKGEAGALIRILQQVQGVVGYLPKEALQIISDELKLPLSEIYGIVSFYSYFKLVPKGKYVLQVCLGTACYVRGGERIVKALAKDYNLEPEGITEDGNFSLDIIRCLGCCGLSPVMAIGDDIHRKVRPSDLSDILSSYK